MSRFETPAPCPFVCSAVFGVLAISHRVHRSAALPVSHRRCARGGAPRTYNRSTTGAIAQLGERLLCKQEVAGSIPAGSISSSGPSLFVTLGPTLCVKARG